MEGSQKNASFVWLFAYDKILTANNHETHSKKKPQIGDERTISNLPEHGEIPLPSFHFLDGSLRKGDLVERLAGASNKY
jgi:hypothetical protein